MLARCPVVIWFLLAACFVLHPVEPASAAGQARAACRAPRGATVEQRLPTARIFVRRVKNRYDDNQLTGWICRRRDGVNHRFLSSYSTFQELLTFGPYATRGRFVAYGATAFDHYSTGSAHVVARDLRSRDARRLDLATFYSPGLAPSTEATVRQIALSAKGDPVTVLRRTPYPPTTPPTPTLDELRDPRAAVVAAGPPGTIRDPAVADGQITWTQDGQACSAPLVDFARPIPMDDFLP